MATQQHEKHFLPDDDVNLKAKHRATYVRAVDLIRRNATQVDPKHCKCGGWIHMTLTCAAGIR